MRLIAIGLLTLLLLPAAWARDDKDKKDANPATPAAEVQKMKDDFNKARQDAFKAVRDAKTPEERNKANEEVNKLSATYSANFLKWAANHATDPAAVDALSWVTQNNPYGAEAAKAGEQLHTLLGKGTNKQLQGEAAYALTQWQERLSQAVPQIKSMDASRLEMVAKSLGKESVDRLKAMDAEKLNKETTALLERIEKEFGEVKHGAQTLGALVKPQLFEMRYLQIGKNVPEIEGEDVDGKKFKLSDYRGKVVLLDFWGHW